MSVNIHIHVNHEVLVWARESLALNRAQNSESTGISPKWLVQWKTGEKQPTLEKWCNAFAGDVYKMKCPFCN
jgi:hypothetical protein